MRRLLVLLALVGLGLVIHGEWVERQARLVIHNDHGAVTVERARVSAPVSAPEWHPPVRAEAGRVAEATGGSVFQCDGRTRCPQMTSCDEAVYFLRHCPGVQMDGDHDGVPCEDQWCR